MDAGGTCAAPPPSGWCWPRAGGRRPLRSPDRCSPSAPPPSSWRRSYAPDTIGLPCCCLQNRLNNPLFYLLAAAESDIMGRFSNLGLNNNLSTGVLKMSIAAPSNPKEITLRGIILGILITLVFTAAQVYLGLKVGLTFATSIPAAVISMALLSAFKDATIQENNIVQTIASAAGTLASVIFVLPGLLMIGWWAEIPFWPTFGACAIGGVLGVMYTVPLRRALVSQSSLPYPE